MFTSRPLLRQKIRELRKSISPELHAHYSSQLIDQFSRNERIQKANSVALYISVDGEIDTHGVIEWCLARGKKVALPVIHPFSKGQLLFLKYDRNTVMNPNRYDIPEPEKPSSSQSAKTDIFSNAEEPGSPKGLFSPESGFGWESYLKSRLESELVRSASSEQDLALMLLRIQGLDKKSPCYNAICKLLQEIFQFKDLIFEYKNDGFAIIDQNKDVDKAMETAEKLFTEIMSILNKWNSNAKTTIGISTRSLRLMSADRLETEAEQALIHADADADSPIVAFRVNPEKYRKYIAEK